MSTEETKQEEQICFIVMPFGNIWDEYYKQIYTPAIVNAGLKPVRADDVFRPGSILQDVVDLLSQASIVLVDISEDNRNVHYELGLAHAFGKPTILVAPKNLQIFFDIAQERILIYDKDRPSWGKELEDSIRQAIRDSLDNPRSAIPTAFMHFMPTDERQRKIIEYYPRKVGLISFEEHLGNAKKEICILGIHSYNFLNAQINSDKMNPDINIKILLMDDKLNNSGDENPHVRS